MLQWSLLAEVDAQPLPVQPHNHLVAERMAAAVVGEHILSRHPLRPVYALHVELHQRRHTIEGIHRVRQVLNVPCSSFEFDKRNAYTISSGMNVSSW